MLAEGYEGFAAIQTKRLINDDSYLVIQHNPRRIRSTAAPVDRQSVAARGCFLCAESLPPEEKGLEFGNLILLCNPFPVLDRHLSIVHRDHVEQKIEGNLEMLLALAAELSPAYFVLYNGPQCGASAPDHLHFQACSRRLLQIEESVRNTESSNTESCSTCQESANQGLELFTLRDTGRSVIVFRTGSDDELTGWVYSTLSHLPTPIEGGEPMVNIICTFDQNLWTLYLFPRTRHRPSCFFAEGEKQLLISPGAIDMAGVVVVPHRDHFDRVDSATIEQIFSEVSLSEVETNEVTERVCIAMGVEQAG